MGAYKGKASTITEAEMKSQSPAFKKGGKADKKVMSEASMGRKARASGGGLLSSAASGTPRGKASQY
jgi:hypothetical protein